MDRFFGEAFRQVPDANAPGGVATDTISKRAAADYKEAMSARFRYLRDLEATYARIASPVQLSVRPPV